MIHANAHPTAPTLVLLAAGLGQRFGGMKQVRPVGPAGETLMDYTLFDARRAGFGRVVFVIRPDMADEFDQTVGRRAAALLPVAYAFQSLTQPDPPLPPPRGRTRPWGTAHAVLAAQASVHAPFAVANADDFYGAEALLALGGFLRDLPATATDSALVAFRLDQTLSPSGPVNRALCDRGRDGNLLHIREFTGTQRIGDEIVGRAPDGHMTQLDGGALVSMNLWGFAPAFVPVLRREFDAFVTNPRLGESDELYLPDVVQGAIARREARVEVLRGAGRWLGLTYPEDVPGVRAALAELVRRGAYPERLAT